MACLSCLNENSNCCIKKKQFLSVFPKHLNVYKMRHRLVRNVHLLSSECVKTSHEKIWTGSRYKRWRSKREQRQYCWNGEHYKQCQHTIVRGHWRGACITSQRLTPKFSVALPFPQSPRKYCSRCHAVCLFYIFCSYSRFLILQMRTSLLPWLSPFFWLSC